MKILALDPSTVCIAWCELDTDIDTIIQYGTFEPGGGCFDDTLARSRQWLFSLVQSQQADVCAIEIPILATYQGKRNVKTFRTLAQLTGVLRVAAYPWTDEIIEVLPAERLTALGLPIKLKSKPAKEQVRLLVNAMFNLDLTPEQHDISDAVAVAVAAQRKLRERELLGDD